MLTKTCISMIFLNKIQTPSSLHIPESYGFARKDEFVGIIFMLTLCIR